MTKITLPISTRRFNSGGPGGQKSNTTDNAVELKVTLPDVKEITATSTSFASQHDNLRFARKILKSRVKDALTPKKKRGKDLGRVRTYNKHDNRVKDHASGKKRSWNDVIDGDGFEELVDARRRALEENLG